MSNIKNDDLHDSIEIDQSVSFEKSFSNENNLKELKKEKKIDLLNDEKDENDKSQEIIFDQSLHKLIIESLWFKLDDKWILEKVNIDSKNDYLEEKNINKILPAIRTQYIRDWRYLVLQEKSSEKMEILITKFDSILTERQKREQKWQVFSKLFWFFWIETFILFLLVWLNKKWALGIDNTTLQILVWVTITQVATMLIFIVKNLYPQDKENKDESKKQ